MKYPHVHLCFDDHSVSNWHAHRGILSANRARATFYVDSFHELSDSEVEMLSELRDEGHLIGCHGRHHRDALAYSKRFDVDSYIDHEVIPAMEEMAGAGFSPTHFAFPLSRYDDALYLAVSDLFCYVRQANDSSVVPRFGKDIPTHKAERSPERERRIRAGEIESVLEEVRSSAESHSGIRVVFHDIRPAGAPAHAGTHARAHITPEELELFLGTLNESGFSYETYEGNCPDRD